MLPRYKDIVELMKKGATVEAQEKILELREAAVELQEENIELKEKIRNLEDSLELRHSLEWDPPYYWRNIDNNKDGPYCQNCWDSNQKLIRLQATGITGLWNCLNCGKFVRDKNYSDDGPVSIRSESRYEDY